MLERTNERVDLGNHAQGYECRTCYAVSASEFGANRHADWHAAHPITRPAITGAPQ